MKTFIINSKPTFEKGSETIKLNPDNHFVKEIDYFVENASFNEKKEEWYNEIIDQAQLIENIHNQF